MIIISKKQLDHTNFGLNIEQVSTSTFVESITWTIKKEKTLSTSNWRFDEIFPFVKKESLFLISKWPNIPIRNCQQIQHFMLFSQDKNTQNDFYFLQKDTTYSVYKNYTKIQEKREV